MQAQCKQTSRPKLEPAMATHGEMMFVIATTMWMRMTYDDADCDDDENYDYDDDDD